MAEKDAKLKLYIDHVGRAVEERVRVHVDASLADINRKIDTLIAMLQNWDVAVINILHVQEDNGLEQMGEMSNKVYILAQADDDRLTYVMPDIEVHFGVLVNETQGDTVQEVTSPISGEKKRTVALQTPYIVDDKSKCQK